MGYVAVSALAVKALGTYVWLAPFGMRSLRAFLAFFFAGIVVRLMVTVPVAQRAADLAVAPFLSFLCDMVAVWAICNSCGLETPPARDVRLRDAAIAALLGDGLSTGFAFLAFGS